MCNVICLLSFLSIFFSFLQWLLEQLNQNAMATHEIIHFSFSSSQVFRSGGYKKHIHNSQCKIRLN